MTLTFKTKNAALAHLIRNDWEPVPGQSTWISKDKTCIATITTSSNLVLLDVWEKQ